MTFSKCKEEADHRGRREVKNCGGGVRGRELASYPQAEHAYKKKRSTD